MNHDSHIHSTDVLSRLAHPTEHPACPLVPYELHQPSFREVEARELAPRCSQVLSHRLHLLGFTHTPMEEDGLHPGCAHGPLLTVSCASLLSAAPDHVPMQGIVCSEASHTSSTAAKGASPHLAPDSGLCRLDGLLIYDTHLLPSPRSHPPGMPSPSRPCARRYHSHLRSVAVKQLQSHPQHYGILFDGDSDYQKYIDRMKKLASRPGPLQAAIFCCAQGAGCAP